MTSPNLDEIVTTTIRSRTKKLADNVTENNALLKKLKQRGRTKTFSGGRTILQELAYAENSTYKRFSGYELLDISPSDVFTAAEYNIRQVAVAVTMSGLEMLQNAGSEQMIDLMESRIENAEATMANELTSDLYSSGTADNGKQVDGLGAALPTNPATGTHGGIDRATWEFWRSKTSSVGAPAADTISGHMTDFYASLCRGMDHPDLIMCDNNTWSRFVGSLQDHQRFTNESNMANRGFNSVRFMQADVALDGGYGGNMSANTQLYINSKYMHYRPHSARDMEVLGPDRYATNQDAMVKLIGWAGNLTQSAMFLHGRLRFV